MVVRYLGMEREAGDKLYFPRRGQRSSRSLNLHLLAGREENGQTFLQSQAGAMKAKSFLLAVSLVANLVLAWMLVRQPRAVTPEPAMAQAAPTEEEMLPLPMTSVPLSAPALLPPLEPQWFSNEPAASSDAPARVLPPKEEKPYAPAPPPNPYAAPAWPERLPHRETQIQRTLLSEPKR
jgi:hypothetical protein